jgi:hypothetical protein
MCLCKQYCTFVSLRFMPWEVVRLRWHLYRWYVTYFPCDTQKCFVIDVSCWFIAYANAYGWRIICNRMYGHLVFFILMCMVIILIAACGFAIVSHPDPSISSSKPIANFISIFEKPQFYTYAFTELIAFFRIVYLCSCFLFCLWMYLK